MTQENPQPPSSVEEALSQLQAALESERASGAADRSASEAALAKLQGIYKWAEEDRQKLYRVHNLFPSLLGMPWPKPGGGHYNVEDFAPFLANLPSPGALAKALEERDVALRDAASYRENATALAGKAQAAEERAFKAEERERTLLAREKIADALQVKLKAAMTKAGIKLP